MKSTLFLVLAVAACGGVADVDDTDANDGDDRPDAAAIEPDAAEIICAPAPALLSVGSPQGGFSAQKTIAVLATPTGGDQLVNAIEIAGIGLFGGTYTLAARIYDVDTQELVASSADVTQDGPFPSFSTTFDISATLTAEKTYAFAVFTSGGGTAATAVVLTDEPLPFDDETGVFRVEGAGGSINDDRFPNLTLNGLPQITVHSCPAETAAR